MPYVNPIVAYIDRFGCPWCVPCARRVRSGSSALVGLFGGEFAVDEFTPIDSGNATLQDDGMECEGCRTDMAALYDPANRIQVPYGSAPAETAGA